MKEECREARRKLCCKEFKAHVHAAGLKTKFISLLPKEMEELDDEQDENSAVITSSSTPSYSP